MAAGDLTTLANQKLFLHISDTSQDSLISALITSVSNRIQTDTQRNFSGADYIEFQNVGARQQRAQVFNKPVQKVNAVQWGISSAIQMTYAGNSVVAMVGISSARQCLINTIGSSGSLTQVINLTQSSVTLCSQLCTQINNSTLGGFTATLYGTIDAPTKWLYETAGLPLQQGGTNFTQSLVWPSINLLTYIIDPLAGTIGFAPLTTMDFFFTPDGGSVSPVSWPGMYQGLMIDYRGGYDTIPTDIELLTQMVVADVFNQSSRDMNVASEHLADYSYSLLNRMQMREYYLDMLAPYRKIGLAGGTG